MTSQFGVHLPLLNFGDTPWTAVRLSAYVREAVDLGIDYVCANDHLVFRRPWMDGPTALASVLQACPDITIATTVALAAVRGPVQTAKMFAALSTLSGGRFVGGVGPGSSAADFAAAGLAFGERSRRFYEAVRVLRILLGKDTTPFSGTFYAADTALELPTPSAGTPPLWIGSWGSTSGVRRVAELGDGWLGSAYNSSPQEFRRTLDRLQTAGQSADFPNALATAWLYVTDQPQVADHIFDDILAPLLNRPADDLRNRGLPIGSAEQCAERIAAYQLAGAQRILLWPVGDEVEQLTAFRTRVVPLLAR